jgi:hypothetical protein
MECNIMLLFTFVIATILCIIKFLNSPEIYKQNKMFIIKK